MIEIKNEELYYKIFQEGIMELKKELQRPTNNSFCELISQREKCINISMKMESWWYELNKVEE